MRLCRLELVNYCNHAHTVLDFKSGTTAIIGRNGAGKSSVLDGLRVALTGNTDNAGIKTANIRFGIGKAEKSYVALDFKHGDVTGRVVRSLKPATPATLEWSAGPRIDGEKEVTNAIQQLIGTDAQTMNEVVLVSQRALFGFIEQTPTARAKYFQALFGLQSAEKVYTDLQQYIRSQLGNTNWQLDIDAKQAHKETVQQAAISLIHGVPFVEADTNPYTAEFHQLQSANQNFARWQASLQTIQNQTARVQQYDLQLASLSSQITDSLAEVANVDSMLAEIGDTASYAATVQMAQRGKLADTQRSQLQSKLDMVLRQLAEPVDIPSLMTAVTMLPSLETEATEKAYQYAAASRALQSAVCTTCSRPFDEKSSHEERAANVQSLRVAATEAEASRNTCRAQVAKLQQWQNCSTERESLLHQLQALESVVVPQEQLDAAKEVLRVANELAAKRNTLLKSVTSLEQQQANVAQQKHGDVCQIATLQLQAADLEKQCAGMDAQAVQARLAVVSLDATNWDRYSRELAVLQATVATLDNDIAVLEHRKVDQAAGNEWLQRVEKVAALFQRDAAPRFVSYHNLQRLEREMNRMLELFCTDFRVTAREDLSFEALFFDGRRQPVERLSGGQATIVAMIFRLAVNTFFAGSVGLIFLDEPTAFLDEHHMRGFEPVLASLREYAAGRGLQCVMITHAKDLAPLFDQTLKIEG